MTCPPPRPGRCRLLSWKSMIPGTEGSCVESLSPWFIFHGIWGFFVVCVTTRPSPRRHADSQPAQGSHSPHLKPVSCPRTGSVVSREVPSKHQLLAEPLPRREDRGSRQLAQCSPASAQPPAGSAPRGPASSSPPQGREDPLPRSLLLILRGSRQSRTWFTAGSCFPECGDVAAVSAFTGTFPLKKRDVEMLRRCLLKRGWRVC